MKRLKDSRKVVILAIIMIIVGLIFSLSKSYAYFETSIAGSNVTMGVGKLIHSLNSDVKLKSGEKKEINLFVKSNDDIDSKYQVYYTSDDDLIDVSVGYSSDSIDLPSGEITAKGSKSVTIVLKNNSDNAGETYTIPKGYHDGTGKVTSESEIFGSFLPAGYYIITGNAYTPTPTKFTNSLSVVAMTQTAIANIDGKNFTKASIGFTTAYCRLTVIKKDGTFQLLKFGGTIELPSDTMYVIYNFEIGDYNKYTLTFS